MNETIFTFFYKFAHINSVIDYLLVFIARDFGFIILAMALVYMYAREDKKVRLKNILVVVGTAIFSLFVISVAKDFFHTLRPFVVLDGVTPLVSNETGFAFPSGHSAFFMAIATILYLYHKRIGLLFGVATIIIGLSRIAIGVHWPVDILGGLFLGFAIGRTARKLIKSMKEEAK